MGDLYARFAFNCVKLSLIESYLSINEDADDAIKDKFYDNLQSVTD